MVNLMGQKLDYLPKDADPNAASDTRYFNGTFQERFADMGVILAVDQQTTTTLYNSYTIKSLNLENDRQSVAGVDLNDEATNMMTFQKSYSAACQLMTTLDSMLERLINGTLR
jgi:flagellar hook-associated protein 1 FlgK